MSSLRQRTLPLLAFRCFGRAYRQEELPEPGSGLVEHFVILIDPSEHHAAFERGNDLKGSRFRIGPADPVRQILNASAEERKNFTGDFG